MDEEEGRVADQLGYEWEAVEHHSQTMEIPPGCSRYCRVQKCQHLQTGRRLQRQSDVEGVLEGVQEADG